uniref:Uncharacterized protein n=1 Tax=Ascaris lumbricoides TaxID=6252 RepID=A0A0M3ICN0_ASCLU
MYLFTSSNRHEVENNLIRNRPIFGTVGCGVGTSHIRLLTTAMNGPKGLGERLIEAPDSQQTKGVSNGERDARPMLASNVTNICTPELVRRTAAGTLKHQIMD